MTLSSRITACTLTALSLTTAASANWFFATSEVGITAEVVGNNRVEGIGPNRTYRLWAVLPDAWRLDAVAGNSQVSLNIAPVNGTFYQNPYGGATSKDVASGFFAIVPSLEWDSFVSIGALDSTGTSAPGGENSLGNIGIDWTDFESEGGAVTSTNGSWFILPIAGQGQSMGFTDACTRQGNGVLLGQFTVMGDDASITGSVLLQGQNDLGSTWQAWIEDFAVDADGVCDAIPPVQCAADVSGDSRVDVMDLMMVLERWDDGGCADVSGDARMSVDDLLVVCDSWGTCGVTE